MKISNVKITGVSLGYEDHGILTAWVRVEGNGMGVGIGGFRLDAPRDNHSTACGAFVGSVLRTLEVDQWEKLPGTIIRIEDNGPGSTCTKIGHAIKDKWCDLREVMKSCE